MQINPKVKPINEEAMYRWLMKLKQQNEQSHYEVVDLLYKLKDNPENQVLITRMNLILLPHVDLTKELNSYSYQKDKFLVARSQEEKMKDFMTLAKKSRPKFYNQVNQLRKKVQQLLRNKQKPKEANEKKFYEILFPQIKEIIMGDKELEDYSETSLFFNEEQQLRRKIQTFNEVNSEKEKQKQKENQQKSHKMHEQLSLCKFLSEDQECIDLSLSLEKLGQETKHFVLKTIKIYNQNAITLEEAIQQLKNAHIDSDFVKQLKALLEKAEKARREQGYIKPLCETDFEGCEWISPSYVLAPSTYPTKCSGKTDQIRKVLNDKWVCVGSSACKNYDFKVFDKVEASINQLDQANSLKNPLRKQPRQVNENQMRDVRDVASQNIKHNLNK